MDEERCSSMDKGAPRVAVVMITYNRREQVLRSLGHLTRLPERRWWSASRGWKSFWRVANSGRRGARHVDTPYVAFADDDSW
jgi:hypothetical protein